MNWDASGVPDEHCDIEDAVTGEVVLDPITEAILRSSSKIGMPEITRSNAREFHTRIKCLERMHGYYMLRDPTDGRLRNPTLQEIVDRVGLSTEATELSRLEFLTRLSPEIWRLAVEDTQQEPLRLVPPGPAGGDGTPRRDSSSPADDPSHQYLRQPSDFMPQPVADLQPGHVAQEGEDPAPFQSGDHSDPALSDAHLAAAGAMLQDSEDAMEAIAHRQRNRAKAVSLGIAFGICGVLGVILAWWTITVFQTEEIELVIAANQITNVDTLDKKQFQQNVRQRPSRPSASPNNTISAAKASPISVPSVEIDLDLPEFGTSFGTGFGGGGFGDGLGGGFGVPGAMRGRCNPADRAARLARAGGKSSTERAVVEALRWLKKEQKDDGSFGGGRYPVAMTGLALLAFSGHCETVDSPEFGETVKRSIEYLVDVAEANKGLLSSTGGLYQQASYEHGIAVYALCEAYSINKNARKPFKRISPILMKSVPIVIEGQTSIGGWLYGYGRGANGDLSVGGWNVQALKAAELTGLKFTGLAEAKEKASKYLEAAEDPNGSAGCYTYNIGGGGKLSLTGVGALCARMMGKPSKLEGKCLDIIVANAPNAFAGANVYAWYYHSQAAFQVQGQHWTKYNDTYQQVVIDAQEKDGSWPIAGGHASNDAEGKVYTTALCTLMLEVYYRYLPATR